MQCTKCKNRAEAGKKLCEVCRTSRYANKKRHIDQWKEQGLCERCGRQKTPESAYCKTCVLKKIAGNNLDDIKRHTEIGILLEEQGSCCAYTGFPLTLGVNASIDHKTPVARGGSNTLDNLHWVETPINRMKGTMTDCEFRPFLKRLVESLSDL